MAGMHCSSAKKRVFPGPALLILLLFISGTTTRLEAAEVSFPKAGPQFTIEVPKNWKAIFRGDNLTLLPDPEDGFVMQINEQPAEATDLLEQLTERIATRMNLSKLEIGNSSDAENEHDVELEVLISRARAQETEVVITVVAFSIGDERHFTVQCIGAVALKQKHNAELLAMMDSIKPRATRE